MALSGKMNGHQNVQGSKWVAKCHILKNCQNVCATQCLGDKMSQQHNVLVTKCLSVKTSKCQNVEVSKVGRLQNVCCRNVGEPKTGLPSSNLMVQHTAETSSLGLPTCWVAFVGGRQNFKWDQKAASYDKRDKEEMDWVGLIIDAI